MKQYNYFLFILLLTQACNLVPKNEKHVLDLATRIEIGSKNIKTLDSDLIKIQKNIKLETNDRSFLASIDKIKLINNKFYILDRTYTSIKIFNYDGSYYGDVGKYGTGKGEYLDILDFTYDKRKNKILVLSHLPGIYEYDLQGKFIKKIDMPFSAGSVAITDSLNYYFLNQLGGKVTEHNNLLILDKKNIILRKLFKIPKKFNGSFTFIGGLFEQAKVLYFNPPLSNIIYKMEGLEFHPDYEFSFLGNNLPIEVRESYFKFIKDGKDFSFLRNSFVKLNNCILFSFVSKQIMQIGAYNLKSKAIATSFNHLERKPISKIMAKDFWYLNDSSAISFIPVRNNKLKSKVRLSYLDNGLKSLIELSKIGDNPILTIFSVTDF